MVYDIVAQYVLIALGIGAASSKIGFTILNSKARLGVFRPPATPRIPSSIELDLKGHT
jgi:hypothetical protein